MMPACIRLRTGAASIALLAATYFASAQTPPGAVRQGAPLGNGARQPPALLFREAWRQPPYTGQLSDTKRRISQAAVTNPELQLALYGADARDVEVYVHEGRHDLWNGLTTSPVAVTLGMKGYYMDLTGLAKLRWMTRTNGLHVIHPVVKLADGTLLVGSHVVSTEGDHLTPEGDYLESEVDFDNQHWFRLDPVGVTTGAEVKDPDLRQVEEIGFADLMPGGGHGPAGWVNVSVIELYARAHQR